MRFLLLLLLFFTSSLSATVYDCFMFANELDLLKIRLAELDEVVDYFVLSESRETHRGFEKPLFFEENKHLFAPYLHKIIHIVVERNPDFVPWQRESHQRNCLIRGLTHSQLNDIILVSDLDEIPRKETLIQAIELIHKNRSAIYVLEQDMYFGYLNCPWAPWPGTVMSTFRSFKPYGATLFRDLRDKLPRIRKGGWHFTWMGGDHKQAEKLQKMTPHTELTIDGLESWKKLFESTVPIDETFPRYVVENQAYFKSIGFIK